MTLNDEADRIAHQAKTLKTHQERWTFIQQACGEDGTLLDQVSHLLDIPLEDDIPSEDDGDHALFGDASHVPEGATLAVFEDDVSEVPEQAGDTIGPYKLREQIGRGGFGVVFVADQFEPVRRRVALKMIKPGMDSHEVVARFQAERQALAMMDHPNIAHVYDAGIAPSGRPYFVMELVRGVPITEYCDTHGLGIIERIELFQDVCRAIQHAHQKGVIHRDIKPSNVLVTIVGDAPCVKVIDFGVAKALHGPLTQDTIYTQFCQMIGTPLYMAPEQAQLSANAVDTRSDVYSLGVLLYALLTGTTPLDKERLSTADASEVRRLVVEEDPPPPSTRFSKASSLHWPMSKQAGFEPADWLKQLRGDVDRIVLKCLEKDPARRYDSPLDLARDLQRFLDNEPVLARAPTLAYRWSKFARRHRLGLSVSAAIVSILIGATIVSVSWAVRAHRAEQSSRRLAALAWKSAQREAQLHNEAIQREREAQRLRQEAENAARNANEVLKFFEKHVLSAARPQTRGGGLGIHTTVKQAVDAARPRIAGYFEDQPEVEASVRRVLGTTYWHLGEYANASAELERSAELWEQVKGPDHHHTLYTQVQLATALADNGEQTRGIEIMSRARESADRLLQQAPAGSAEQRDYEDLSRIASHNLAALYQAAHDLPRAEAEYRRLWNRYGDDADQSTREWLLLASNYAVVLQGLDRWDESSALLHQAYRLAQKKLGPRHAVTLLIANNLAPIQARLGKYDQAADSLKYVWDARRQMLGDTHPDTLTTLMNLAAVRALQEDHRRAADLYIMAWNGRLKRYGAASEKTANAAIGAGSSLGRLQRHQEAAKIFGRAFRGLAMSRPEHTHTLRLAHYWTRSLESAQAWPELLDACHELRSALHSIPDLLRISVDTSEAVAEFQLAADKHLMPDSVTMDRLGVTLWSDWQTLESLGAETPSVAAIDISSLKSRLAHTIAVWCSLSGNGRDAIGWDAVAKSIKPLSQP